MQIWRVHLLYIVIFYALHILRKCEFDGSSIMMKAPHISHALQMTNLSWAPLAFFLLKKIPSTMLNKVSTPAALGTESDATVPKSNHFHTPRRVFFYINVVDGRNISGVWAILRPLHCCPCAPYTSLHLFIP
ncbi:unnamed protein product [Ixodes pacificus]